MANTQPHLFNTELSTRTLWFDGDSSVSYEELIKLVSSGVDTSHLSVTELTPAVKKFNSLVEKAQMLNVKQHSRPLKYDWTIGEEYNNMDVEDYVFDALETEIKGMSKSDQLKRIRRVELELKLFTQKSLLSILKLMVFVVNTFTQQGVVWGVGRGSSVSSYILFLIGVHDVDSVEFELPIQDFLRD